MKTLETLQLHTKGNYLRRDEAMVEDKKIIVTGKITTDTINMCVFPYMRGCLNFQPFTFF